MKTLFEINEGLENESKAFNEMMARAKRLLSTAENGEFTQAVVLYSKSGAEYSMLLKNACTEQLEDERALLDRLKNCNDTEIQYLMCMWADNCIDIPSFALRKMLCEVNPKNSETLIFVMTTDGVSFIKLSKTMK